MPETFSLSAPDRRQAWWIIAIATSIAVALVMLALNPDTVPMWKDGRPMLWWLALMCAVVVYNAWERLRTARRADVTVDDEGIWPAGADRGVSLVTWDRVVALREKQSPYRIELLSMYDGVLFTIRDSVSDFERLREIVVNRASLSCPDTLPDDEGGVRWIEVAALVLLAGFVIGGLFALWQSVLIGMPFGAIVTLAAWQHLQSGGGLTMHDDGLVVRYPFPRRSRRIPWTEVERIGLGDRRGRSSRWTVLQITVRGKRRKITVSDLTVDGWTSYRTILSAGAREKAAFVRSDVHGMSAPVT